MKYNQALEPKLRRGCTSVRGIGLKDIQKIRKINELKQNNAHVAR